MLDLTLLSLFIPTFFVVSITPGMCMTLAMSLGISLGLRKTFWMMWGELLGVAIVALAAVLGVAASLLKYPQIFVLIKLLGGAYLCYVGINMWRSKGKLAISHDTSAISVSNGQLFQQGFITAIANPKGWAFMIALLPPFINTELALVPQLSILLSVILITEFFCLILYASGGKTLAKLLCQQGNIQRLNKLSGSLMIAVALWLAFG